MRPATENIHPIGKRGLKVTTQSNHCGGIPWGINNKSQFGNIKQGLHSERQQLQNYNKTTISMEKTKPVNSFRTERVTSEKTCFSEKKANQLNSKIQKKAQTIQNFFLNPPQTRTNSSHQYSKHPVKKIPLRHLKAGIMKNQETPTSPREKFPSKIQVRTPEIKDTIREQLTVKLQKLQKQRNLDRSGLQKMRSQLNKAIEQMQKEKIRTSELQNKNERMKVEIYENQKRFQNLEKIISEKQKQILKLTNLSSSKISDENHIQTLKKSRDEALSQLGKAQRELTEKSNLLEEQRQKVIKLQNEKRLLLDQYHKLDKIRKLVKQLEICNQKDKVENIKVHIAYEIDAIDANKALKEEALQHFNDIQFYKKQYHNLCVEVEIYKKQFQAKVFRIMKEKERLIKELSQTHEEIEKVKKQMMQGNKNDIQKLKVEIINLREKNIDLSNNSEQKIQIIKLQRDNKILNTQIIQLHKRNKQLEESCSKFENMKKKSTQKDLSQTTSSPKNQEYFDVDGATNLPSILKNYEQRALNLTEQIQEKSNREQQMVKIIQKIEGENNELKGKLAFFERKEQALTQNNKNKIQSIQQTLKAEIESLTRKIQTHEESTKRKNKQIFEKDKFITSFLLSRIKDEKAVEDIIEEIRNYFEIS